MRWNDRLSNDVAQAHSNYDVIVVGSGYGAGVAALRFSQAGLSCAVLERGRERIPGEFPTTLTEAAAEFQFHRGQHSIGDDQALFDMRAQSDVSVMVGCGLGGTSLINGNVMLEPEPRVLQAAQWPQQLGSNATQQLAPYYQLAREMLGSKPYPNRVALQKLEGFRRQASAIDGELTLPPINVTFENEDNSASVNRAGVEQAPCTLCGDCCSGCNVGAKNTVAMNYLPAARAAGAALFTGADVRWLEKTAIGYRLHYFHHTSDSLRSIDSKRVVLGAGTLGSTEILLRSRERGLIVSDTLGKDFSGNGDVIAFAYNNDQPINGIGVGNPPLADLAAVGPVIAGLIDLRGDGPVANNIVIQEGVLPSPIAPLLPALLSGASPLFGDDTDSGDFWAELSRSFKSLVSGAYSGAVHNTQTFLVMAHETNTGQLRLSNDKLAIDWPDAGKDPVFKRISDTLEQATRGTGGTYIANPIWSKALGRNLVSVHPLGGCTMGDDAASGVVDHLGQVFCDGKQVHEGLYVLDGSVVPRSLGVNPSLTITALAERAVAHILA